MIAVAVLLVAAAVVTSYAWHIRKLVTAIPIASLDTRPLAPPIAGPTERVVLFVAHDDDGSLHAQSAEIPMPSGRQERAEELLRALVAIYLDKNSPHVLGPGADLRLSSPMDEPLFGSPP